MKTIVTIHHHYTLGRAGFETSQQTRMTLAKLNSFNYLHLITSPQIENYKSRFEEVGFTYGDIQALDEYLFQTNAAKIDAYEYRYYDNDGNEVGSAIYDESSLKIPTWIYTVNGKTYTEEDLVIKYLSELGHNDMHVLIRDDSRIPMRNLVRFAKNLNYRYFEYIHHNVVYDGYLPTLSKKIDYLVANEQVAELLKTLGYKAHFLPPMCVFENELITKKINGVKRYVWSAHLGDYKNFDQALQIMKALEDTDITLDVYGGTREEFLNICELTNCYPRNVTYLGLVNNVPYQKYDGYISTSNHEMFSNACVEAMSHGLKCIVSNLEHPYQFYSRMTDNEVEIAHNTKEYIALMVSNSEKEFTSDSQFSFLKRYSYESWAPLFKELISER